MPLLWGGTEYWVWWWLTNPSSSGVTSHASTGFRRAADTWTLEQSSVNVRSSTACCSFEARSCMYCMKSGERLLNLTTPYPLFHWYLYLWRPIPIMISTHAVLDSLYPLSLISMPRKHRPWFAQGSLYHHELYTTHTASISVEWEWTLAHQSDRGW